MSWCVVCVCQSWWMVYLYECGYYVFFVCYPYILFIFLQIYYYIRYKKLHLKTCEVCFDYSAHVFSMRRPSNWIMVCRCTYIRSVLGLSRVKNLILILNSNWTEKGVLCCYYYYTFLFLNNAEKQMILPVTWNRIFYYYRI